MPGPVEKEKAINIIKATCTTYVSRQEIDRYFEENYKEKKEFDREELIEIGKNLIQGKERKTQTFHEIFIKNGGRISNTKNKKTENNRDER